jgi:hypothetical protein
LFLLVAGVLLTGGTAHAVRAPRIEWQKSLGGSGSDIARSIRQTADGGYIVAGYSKSTDGDVAGNHGRDDSWIVKLDAGGNFLWQKSLGGSGSDSASSIQQTADGGYIVAGYSNSTDGDVAGNHSLHNCWIVKLDAEGKFFWQKSLGGSGFDYATSIQQTTDGGYIIAGSSNSNSTGGDVFDHSDYDCWIVKLDAEGKLLWQKSLGGSGSDYASSIQQTVDGEYIISGSSNSNNGDVVGNHGNADSWVAKLDAGGKLVWQKPLGGSGDDGAYSVQQTADGEYIVAGSSSSNNGDVSGNHGGDRDYWIVKLNAEGNLFWQRALGGSDARGDIASSIQQTTDGGYIVAGWSASNDGDVSGNHGNYDYWIVRMDAEGKLLWQRSLGGSGVDIAHSVQQTADGGYIVAGWSASNDGDVTGNHGKEDYWIVKLGPDGSGVIEYNQEDPASVVRAFAMALIEGDEAVVRQLLDPNNPFLVMQSTEFYDLMSDVEEKNMFIQSNREKRNSYYIRNNVTGVPGGRMGKRSTGGEGYIKVDLARIGKKYVVTNITH